MLRYYDRVVALKGRHGFQEEVASKAKSFLSQAPGKERGRLPKVAPEGRHRLPGGKCRQSKDENTWVWEHTG